jgi:NPCBM-associated, NEW3 domain of alpha-galactosidase
MCTVACGDRNDLVPAHRDQGMRAARADLKMRGTEMIKSVKGAAVATAVAALALVGGTAAAASTTPVVGVGVGGNGTGYIGDTTGYANVSSDYSFSGTSPIAPGTAQTWVVRYTNAGNVTEKLSVQQTAPAWLGGTPIPSSWVSFSPTSASNFAPGAHVDVTVRVSVPAGAKARVYDGVLMGTGVASSRGSGNIINAVGAGDREYVRVR